MEILTLLYKYKVYELQFNSQQIYSICTSILKKNPQFLRSLTCAHAFVLCTSHWHTLLSILWLIVSSMPICFQKSHQSFELCKDNCSFWHHKPAVQDLLRTSLLKAPASLCEQTLRFIGNENQVLMSALEG